MNHDYRKKLFNNQLSSFPKPKEGAGLVNSLIDNLPLEVHVPGYEYLGPGTNLDLKLSQGVKPKNKLDEAAKNHDIAYARSSDVTSIASLLSTLVYETCISTHNSFLFSRLESGPIGHFSYHIRHHLRDFEMESETALGSSVIVYATPSPYLLLNLWPSSVLQSQNLLSNHPIIHRIHIQLNTLSQASVQITFIRISSHIGVTACNE